MNIFVLSSRALCSTVSWDPVFELENIIVRTCNAQLLMPSIRDVIPWSSRLTPIAERIIRKVVKSTTGFYNLPPLPELSDKPNILVLIGISGADLDLLSSIPKWRERFDVVIAYIFDSWEPGIYSQNVYHLDHLFVALPEVIDELKRNFGIPVSLIPFAADVLGQGSCQIKRSIDLTSFGRIPSEYDRVFLNKFNQPGSEQIYFKSTPRNAEYFPSLPYEKRKDEQDTLMLFHILRHSKITLAFDTLYPGMRPFPYSFITLRWFYGAATGGAVVGKRPTTYLMDELLNWEDATIELPDDPQKSVEFIDELLRDEVRLNSIYKRNYVESLARHDWRHRIQSMLETAKIPLPRGLQEELSQIEMIHYKMVG
ncbi:glycosyltransferase [Tychonema sp. BBK16]|uniref:glycosyltransferase n=1 Tax=Tychonema sp. BBK16 TaxID=2699888 RepID=UPI001F174222|nr:glycosyltransferase [Tychonema sp. BBK16]MCF6373113.1 glycosyltransferase [Tychonema sp. BBK16]